MKNKIEIIFNGREEMLILDVKSEKKISALIEIFSKDEEHYKEGFKSKEEPTHKLLIFNSELNLGILSYPEMDKNLLFDIIMKKKKGISSITYDNQTFHFTNQPQMFYINEENGSLIMSAFA